MRRFFAIGPAVLVALTVGVALLAAPGALRSVQVAQIGAQVSLARASLQAAGSLQESNAEYRMIAQSVLPGVVHIEASGSRPWRQSSGSGWIWDDRGHIITNSHVVGSAETVRVEMWDSRVRTARVVGNDPATDIAVLRMDPGPGIIPLERATGEALHIGEQVFAFGSPFGIKFSMSRGIVSGLGRSEAASFVNMQQGYTNFIQTDAAMNPGNSGGPIVDIDGRVVGMAAAIANNFPEFGRRVSEEDLARIPDETTRNLLGDLARSLNEQPRGQSAGIGFAIPLETIESVVSQLITAPDQPVLRGYLGVQMQDWNRREARAQGFEGAGVLISGVPEGQPASRAGLMPNDIILSIDGRPTPTGDVLRSVVSVIEPGRAVDVVIWRGGEEQTVQVRIGAARLTGGRPVYIEGSESMSLDEMRNTDR